MNVGNVGYLGQEVQKRSLTEILKSEDVLTRLKSKVISLIGDFFKANEQLLQLKGHLRELYKRADTSAEAEKLLVENDILSQRREGLEKTVLRLSDEVGKLKTKWDTDPTLKNLKETPSPETKILGSVLWVFINKYTSQISSVSLEAIKLSRDWLILKKDIEGHYDKVYRLSKGKIPFRLTRVFEAPAQFLSGIIQWVIIGGFLALGFVFVVLPRIKGRER